MKTITIKRRRRMTKHRKGMTKPRKSNRRIKNRKHKTRRQSGGWGWKSFIKAQHNPLKIVFENDLFLLLRMVTGKNKGIDVKYKTESSGNRVWLIGNTDKTFKELQDGAKDRRYVDFIKVLLEKRPYFNNFETPEEDRDSSKGIILTDEQFCEMFINEPVRDDLNYPGLIEKFNSSGFKCTSSGPSGTSAAPIPKFFRELQEIKKMGLPNVTEQMIAYALNNTDGNVEEAKAILQIAAADSGVSAAGTVRGGPSAALSAAPTRAPTRATIQDFLNAQDGNFPRQLSTNGSCPTYDQALSEINEGQKKKCWIWYILPSSPGQSVISKFFGIGPGANVTPEQYLIHPILGPRYLEMLNAIGIQLINYMKENAGRPFDDVTKFLIQLMGKDVDYEKLKGSLTIFYPILFERGLVDADGEIALLYRNIFPETLLGPPTGPSAAPTRAPTRAPTSAEPAWVAQLKEMGYGQSLINQALEKGIKSVDDTIDYISSMSQAEQVLPVTNLSFIHTIAIADLMNPDVFVTKYVQYYGLQFVKTDSYQIDLHNRSLRDFNKCPDVADWLVMQTIGDGNCLTHAFLQCRSSMYRKIHVKNKERPDEKIAVAQAFRLAFARSNDARFSLNKNPIVMNEFTAGDGRTDLGEGTFAYYAVLFNVILVVFDINQNAIMVANLTKDTAKTGMPVIFVHGDGIHFSSVLPANPSHAEPYVLTYETAIKIECLKEPLSLTNPVVFNL